MTRPELSHIPERINGLAELAYNLWWSWHPEARILFKQLNPHYWKDSSHNPVKMLRDIPEHFLEGVAENPDYLRRYDIELSPSLIFHRNTAFTTLCRFMREGSGSLQVITSRNAAILAYRWWLLVSCILKGISISTSFPMGGRTTSGSISTVMPLPFHA
jgi:hypothetical protein